MEDKFQGNLIEYKEALVKNKLLSLVAGMLFIPTMSFAIGLGSVRTYSSLNEQLRAEIPVLSVKQKGRMSVALAPNAIFAQRGVTRVQELNNLRFSLIKKGGRDYVKISSIKHISTPYLSFILQLKSSEGTIYRKYAIFLDPASSRNKRMTSTLPKPKATKRSYTTNKATRKSARSVAAVATGKAGRYGPVRRGETLWSIADHVRPSENISVRAMLNLLRKANPQLRYGLKTGVVLRVPTVKGYAPYQGGYAKMPVVKKRASRTYKKSKPKKIKKSETSKTVTALHQDVKSQVSDLQIKKDEAIKKDIFTNTENQVKDAVNSEKEVQVDNLMDQQATIKKKIDTVADELNDVTVSDKPQEVEAEVIVTPQTTSITQSDDTADVVVEQLTVEESAESEVSVKEAVEPKVAIEKTVESQKAIVSEPSGKIEQPIVTAPKPKVAVTAKPTTNNFPLMPILGGAGALLTGLLALFFLRRKRKSENTEKVVLLSEDDIVDADDTDEQNLIIEDEDANEEALLIDEVASEVKEEVIDDGELDFSENLLGINSADIENGAELEDDFEAFLSSADEADDLSDDESDPFDDDLFAMDKEDFSALNSEESSLDDEEKPLLLDNDLTEVPLGMDNVAVEIDEKAPLGDDELDLNFDLSDEDDDVLEVSTDLQGFSEEDSISDELMVDFDVSDNTDEADFDNMLAELDEEKSDDDVLSFDLSGGDDLSFDINKEETVASTEEEEVLLSDNVVEFSNEAVAVEDSEQAELIQEDSTNADSVNLSDFDDLDFNLDEVVVSTATDLENVGEDIDVLPEAVADKPIEFTDNNAISSLDTAESEEINLEAGDSEIEMKLAMAETFISVSNFSRAKDLLQHVTQNGSATQVERANNLLKEII